MNIFRIGIAVLLLGFISSYTQADTKISAMPAASALAGTEKIAAVQSGANVVTTPAAITTYVNANASLPATAITSSTLNAARLPTFSGDCTTPGGSGVLTCTKLNGTTPGGVCTNQAVTSISSSAVPTCTTLTSAYVDTTIAKTGTDINTSNQVTVTHLAAPLPQAQGGSGTTTATGTGNLVLATSPTLTTPNLGTPSAITLTNATGLPAGALPAFSGDCTTAGASSAITCTKTNTVAFGPAATVATTTGSGSVVLATSPTLITPALGTPSALVLTNATGLPDGALSSNIPLKNAANAFTNTGSSSFTGAVSADKVNVTGATSFSAPANGIYLISANVLGFSSNTTERFRVTSAGIQIDSGGLVSAGTKFTASGCSNSTTVGGATAGSFLSGTTGTCTVTITLPTAPNGWVCHSDDLTTPANFIGQSASTTTSCTVTGTTISGDAMNFMAIAF